MEKIKVTQDYLYEYLKGHNVNISRIAESMGVSIAIVTKSFKHDLNRLGKPISFSDANLLKLNAALPVLAKQISECTISFGSPEVFTNRVGRTYDPGAVSKIKSLSRFFNIKGLTARLLMWKSGKYCLVLCTPSSKVYGYISAEDIMRINAELLAVSGTLAGIEVVNDTSNSLTLTPVRGEGNFTGNEFSDAELDAYEDQLLNDV